MAVYETRKCPKCKHRFEWMVRSYSSFGDPRVKCPKCGTTVLFNNIKEWELRSVFNKSNMLFKEYVFVSLAYMVGVTIFIFLGLALIPAIWGSNYNETFKGKYEIIMWAVIISITLTIVIMKRHQFISSEIKGSKDRMKNKTYREDMYKIFKKKL